ncbi:hypothetical protein [Bacillus niameyensis]|uniref:hypothetical protein n=1 Tax=Bacillus niameyensis TaxID=1522308 RepID=UPI000784DC57|nr:hypothetical protein [Bacillus niameyensis]
MMHLYELEPYILTSCKFLGLKATKISPSIWNIKIPQKFINEFNGQEEISISFEKNNNPKIMFITFESYFTQKIAELVAEYNSGVSSGIRIHSIQPKLQSLKKSFSDCELNIESSTLDNNYYILIWFKTTVNLNLTEEYLKCFKYNIKTGNLETPPNDDECKALLFSIKEELIVDLPDDLIDKSLNKLYSIAKEDAEVFVQQKQEENSRALQEEVKRINQYYDLLISENEVAESSKGLSPEEEHEYLKKERESLIEQQIFKYNIRQKEVTIEPVALLLLNDKTESAIVQVSNEYGRTVVDLTAKKTPEVNCSITGTTNGPFTITSDNLIVRTDSVFSCSNCNKSLGTNKMNNCGVCHTDLCPECIKISAISQSTLCKSHYKECQTCLNTVSSEELHLCNNCGQFCCKSCNLTNICELCRSLKPISSVTPQIKQILDLLPSEVKAKKYDSAIKGNRIAILGRGSLFKSFFIVYDQPSQKIITTHKYGLFNKKR